MTIVEHGLYGGAIVYSSNPELFWWGVLFGMLPDILSFAPLMYEDGLKYIWRQPSWLDESLAVSERTYKRYYLTHSFITTLILFIILRSISSDFSLLAISYGFHILCDIPLHNDRFATRFLYPLSNYYIRGYSQKDHRWILYLQYPILFIIYFFLLKRGI